MRGTASALLLTVLAAAILHAATAQECGEPPQLIFKRPADPAGQRSYITSPGQPLHFALNVPLPPVILQVISAEGIGFDFSYDGLQIVATAEPSLRLGGSSVDVNRGEAVFDALTIEQLPQSGAPELVFTLKTHDGTILALRTAGVVSHTQAELADPSSLRFANNGYFTRPNRGRQIPVAPAVLPTVLLEVVNAIGYPIVMQDVTIDVTASDGATVSPAQFTTTEINGLAIQATSTQRPVLTFTASATLSDGSPWTATVVTGALIPVTAVLRNRFMLFDESRSFIKTENEGNTAVLGVPLPPVVINLYTSGMERDTSNTGLIITATTPQGTLSGAEALVVRGVATFSELVFVGVAPRSAVITFTAGTQGGTAVAGSTLLSGAMVVSITAVRAKHISFYPDSPITGTTEYMAMATGSGAFSLPPIRVTMLDSAYKLDATANGFSMKLSVVPTTAVTGGPTEVVAGVESGMVIFDRLNWTSSSSPFRVQISDVSAVGATAIRSPIVSGLITARVTTITSAATATTAMRACQLVDAAGCVLTLAFASEYGTFSSHVFEEDQQLFTTVGGQIPTIVVALRDQFGVATSFPDAVAPALVAYTADDPDSETLLVTEGGANRGLWQNGRYYFSCLQFTAVPTGLVRIQFMPIDESSTPAIRLLGVVGESGLRTGFVTVTQAPTPNFGLRFKPSQSAVAYPGQRLSAVANVALPRITIEVVDSLGRLDATASGYTVVASTSAGNLNAVGATESVTRGTVSFSSLLFIGVADDPEITFTVFGTTAPVASRTLKTGIVTMSTLPIPQFQLMFHPKATTFNNVTYGFQPLAFGNNTRAIVRAAIVLADSASEQDRAFSQPITVRVSSDTAVLGGTLVAQITPDPTGADTACGGCARFATEITAYRPGVLPGTPIYLSFTADVDSGHLPGKAIVVGPVSVADFGSAGSASCAANLVSPAVVGEFRLSKEEFFGVARNVPRELAYLMGVPLSRISLTRDDVVPIVRVDHSTLATWNGVKATLTFTDPDATSTNRKSSAELAASFVALRPGCDATTLGLAAAYYKEDDRSCNAAKFQASLESSRACVAEGEFDLCQCFGAGVIADWGQVCAEEPSLRATLEGMCKELTNCAEAEIQNVCDTILPQEAFNLVWLWATLGAGGGVALIAGGVHWHMQRSKTAGMTLNRYGRD